MAKGLVMLCTGDDHFLPVAIECRETGGPAGDADGQIGVVFRMSLRVAQDFRIGDIDLQITAAVRHECLQKGDERLEAVFAFNGGRMDFDVQRRAVA